MDHSPKKQSRGFSVALLGHARQRYEETDETQDSIAADLGVDRRTLSRLAEREGWALRKDRPPRDLPGALRIDNEATQALGQVTTEKSAVDQPDIKVTEQVPLAPALAVRLELAVEKELRKVEALRGEFGKPAQRSIEAERIARTLATLTETLFKVRRLRELGTSASGTEHDDLPADIDGFRRSLAQRIGAFVHSRADRGVCDAGEALDSAAATP